VHVIALGAGQSLAEVHGMVHSIFVIIAKGSHMPEMQSDAWVQVVQSCESAPPSPPLDEPLLDPLELPELLPLLDPLELPELLPLLDPLELPELLPVLDPLELPEELPDELPELLPLLDPLSASDPELEPGPTGPDDDELEHAAGMPKTRNVDAARARAWRDLMLTRMTRRRPSRKTVPVGPPRCLTRVRAVSQLAVRGARLAS
jgi:hypothetical protein